ncbi:DUF4845 domain-containing protein [Nitrosomonas sp.]|uniref:DUF4845 domain-containing protein n=1 Tax=Nitrosomonas sp. TaxID=42353 RepID=UPI001DFD5859|nr:DUF4845 domain-containing protein [Nitrosomonas sp.]MBX3616058.1 DUF4845 domain-containing protein [Nitrosomonas sp.]
MKYYATLKKQKGISLSGLLLWGAIIVILAVFTLKVAPVYLEYFSIKKNFNAIIKETSLQTPDLHQIRTSFGKRASIDNIKSINAQDIHMRKENGRFILSTKYTVKIPLASNISLHIDFEADSD